MANLDELQMIQFRRAEIMNEMTHSRDRMQNAFSSLTTKDEIPSDKWGKTAYLISTGAKIMTAVKLGLKIGRAIRSLTGHKK